MDSDIPVTGSMLITSYIAICDVAGDSCMTGEDTTRGKIHDKGIFSRR